MLLRLHFLCSHLEFFQDNAEDFREEKGERFQQDIESMERRCRGWSDSTVMEDYIWCLMSCNTSSHKQKAISAIYF